MLLAQNNPEPSIGCGTTINSEEYTLDRFFVKNQELVDILINNTVNIEGETGIFTKKLILKK